MSMDHSADDTGIPWDRGPVATTELPPRVIVAVSVGRLALTSELGQLHMPLLSHSHLAPGLQRTEDLLDLQQQKATTDKNKRTATKTITNTTYTTT